MALSYTMDSAYPFQSWGAMRAVFADVTFDSSYATGGETIDLSKLGLMDLSNVIMQQPLGYILQADIANKKLKVFEGGLSASSPTGSFTGTPATISPTAAFTGSPDTISPTAAFTGTPDTISPTAAYTADGTNFQSVDLYDIKGSINTSSENVDNGALPLNGNAVAANATVAAGTWAHGALTNPDIPRNVCIVITNDSGGPLNLFEGVMTFAVTGTGFDGSPINENITFTSTAGNKAVATANYRYVYGARIFKTVTNITLDNVPDNGLKIGAGIGSKISLLHPLKTLAEADVLRTAINDTNYAFAGKVDTATNSIDFGSLADGDDVHAMFAVVSGRTGTVAVTGAAYTPAGSVAVTGAAYTPAGSVAVTGAAYTPAGSVSVSGFTATEADEVTAAKDLSSLTVKCIFIGKGF